jgi:hypothetical protein
MMIPDGAGTTPLFREVANSTSASYDINDYEEWVMSNGNLDLAVVNNKLVVNIL